MQDKPDYYNHDEFQQRLTKIQELKTADVDPYPHSYKPTHSTANLSQLFGDDPVGNSQEAQDGQTPSVKVAGRLVLFRAMGKNAFAHLQDSTGRIQLMFNRDATIVEGYHQTSDNDPKPIKFIEKKFDLGDIIGIEGNLFRTQKGELTIFVKKATMLCKTLLPLPDKHAGLSDVEMRYRKRWLDLISNDSVKNTFLLRSKIIKLIRDFFEKESFIEVETPILQNNYGGAEARPFETFHNALSQPMYMRIALEIALKKLIIGGFDRVFEIGKVFRNEGIDRTHNPEFTMLEAYGAFMDYNDMMRITEECFAHIIQSIYGSLQLPTSHLGEDVTLDFTTPWKRISMKDALKEYGHLDVDTISTEQLRLRLAEFEGFSKDDAAKLPRGLIISNLFEEIVEPHLIQPHHITDHPIETTPLCKPHRNPEERDRGIIERFESYILGKEICNAYSELNDPILQRSLLEDQVASRENGNLESHPLDEEFMEAICQGMPPTGGLGIGIDRVIMILTSSQSIRDVLFFPTMKQIKTSSDEENTEAS